MRIVLVCPLFPPHPGGLADHTACWADAMSRYLGHEVCVLTGPGAEQPDKPAVHLAEPFSQWGAWRAEPFVRAVARLRPDVVVVQYVPHLYQRWGLSAAFAHSVFRLAEAGFPVVTLAHELYFSRAEAWRHQPAGWLQRAALWPLFAASRRVVFSVPRRERRMRELFPAWANRFVSLPVGANFSAVDAEEGVRWRVARGIASRELVLLFQGGAHPSKEFASVQRSIDALLAAGIPARLMSIGGCHFVGSGCVSLGHVPRDEAASILQAADVAVAPFVDGASGRRGSLMNALAAGLPTVSTMGADTEPGWFPPEVIRLVPPGEPATFAAAVRELAEDPSQRLAMASAARRWFDDHFSWPVLAQAWGPLLEAAHGGDT